MNSFLKQVRQGLLGGRQVGKHLGYSIGEILLVMIGILLALQVNQWNQQRLDRQEERQIRANLHEEFHKNKSLIHEFHLGIRKIMGHCQALRALVGAEAIADKSSS